MREVKNIHLQTFIWSIYASQGKIGLHAQQFLTNWKTIQKKPTHSESQWVFSLDMYCLLLGPWPPCIEEINTESR